MFRAILSIMVILVSGCISPAPGDDPASSGQVDLSECRWTYPDNSTLDCDGDAEEVEAMDLGPEWVSVWCLEDPNGNTFKLLWSAIEDQHAIEYDIGAVNPVSGYLYIGTEQGPRLFNWNNGSAAATLPLQAKLQPFGSMVFQVYDSMLVTDHPRFQDAQLYQTLAWFRGQAWAVHHVHSDGEKALFHNATQLPGGYWETLGDIYPKHGGYNFSIEVQPFTGGEFDFYVLAQPGVETGTPLEGCTGA